MAAQQASLSIPIYPSSNITMTSVLTTSFISSSFDSVHSLRRYVM